MRWKRQRPNLGKGALAGLLGGLAASFVMNRFQAAISKAKEQEKAEGQPPESASSHGAQQQKRQHTGEEPATVRVAAAIAETVDREMRPEQREPAGNLVHYLFGTISGGVYGALAEQVPTARAGLGTLFGSVLWLVSDEIAVPALGLSRGPTAYPARVHATALASHLVYGTTTELVRRAVRHYVA